MAHGDKSYFLNIAQRPGEKPAPFIPILDNNFEVWFKKVQALRMVFEHSSTHSFIIGFSLGVGGYRSCLRPGPSACGHPSGLQGPVAVRHSTKKDELIKEMLDNVVSGLTAKVLERYYGSDESKIPAIDYLGVKPAPVSSQDIKALKV